MGDTRGGAIVRTPYRQNCRRTSINGRRGTLQPISPKAYDDIMNQPVATHIELRLNRANQPRAFIVGTRVRVQDVAMMAEHEGYTADAIANALPHLSLGMIHAALAYYFDHREDILNEIREDEEYVRKIREETGPGPLEEKLRALNAEHPISPR
jgi:uncharacterized protein (DUF433 family)